MARTTTLARAAFTLVELLVVLAIIVVLLALLTPALDRAVYAAEMALCMSNENAAARAGIIYTGEFKRHYPYRAHVIATQGGSYSAINMNNGAGPNADDRIIFRGYFDVNKTLNCPLNKKLDYVGSKPGILCYSDYAMWMGWQVGGERGMFKLGDRFTWKDLRAANPATGPTLSSNALISSFAQCWVGGVPAYADHPDTNGLWREIAQESQEAYWSQTSAMGIDTPYYPNITWSTFVPDGHPYSFDMNFALDDNSVRRINNITPNMYEEDGVQWTRSWNNPDPKYANFTPLPAN